MNVGLSFWLDRPARDAAEFAAAAEEAGFSDVWVPDHYFLRDTFVALAQAAERTSRIRLGASVASPLLRHPVLLASSFATIDEMSAGRAVVGLGPGGFEFRSQLHMDMRSPLTIMRESIGITRALLSGTANLEGSVFTASGAKLGWEAKPLPIYMAARGPRMMELAGELADGVITHCLSQPYVQYVTERLAMGAQRGKRKADACELCLMFEVELDDDRAAAVERLRRRSIMMIGGSYAEELIPVYGLDPAQVLPIRKAVRVGDNEEAFRLLTADMAEAFGVAGSADDLARALAELESRGVKRTIIGLGGGSLEEIRAKVAAVGTALGEAAG